MYMYSYVLYLLGFYSQYYDDEPKPDVKDEVAQKTHATLKKCDKKDMITNYQDVIDELKIKLKARNHLDE